MVSSSREASGATQLEITPCQSSFATQSSPVATASRPAPKTEMQCEQDMIAASVAELSRQARRQQIARLTTAVTSAWTRNVDRLLRPSREAQQRKDLLERMDNMPSYMLKDIGVSRDQVGRFCHTNDYGMLVELVPAAHETPAIRPTAVVEGRGLAYAAQ